MKKEEQVLAELWTMFNKRTWLNGVKMKARLAGYNPSEIHCIDYVGENAESNVTKLADAFFMTRSAISKLTKKLIGKGLIESYQKPGNKKEIYFRLTAQGCAVNEIHRELHKEYEARDSAVFAQITDQEWNTILRFATLYNGHLDVEIEKLGLDLKSGGFDHL